MNKTVSISLSGQVFQIDEQAYDQLKDYLESIRRRFSVSDGGQEIIADIEARIAELFSEKLNERKQVITLADVDDMMQHMGRPEEFETAGETEEPTAAQQKASKRLFKNPDDKIIGGVCSGISAYFGMADPLWMRLAFVFAVFFSFGSPIFIYIILWMIVPDAKTASEKLQMKGENINISNIEKTIKDDFCDLKMRIENINTGTGTQRARNFFERLIALAVNIVVVAFKVVLKFTAALLIFIGLVIIFALIVTIAFPAYTDGFTLSSLYPLFFGSQLLVFLGVLGVALLVGIPALTLALIGFHLLLKNKRRIRGLGVSLFGLWLVGLGLVAFAAAKTASDFRASDSVRMELPLVQPVSDTLFLESKDAVLPKDAEEYEFFGFGIFTPVDSEYIVSGRVRLVIKKSPAPEFQLTKEVESRGRNSSIAGRKAGAVSHQISQTDSSLVIAGLLSFPLNDHFRGQEVKLTLKVPEGKSVFLAESLGGILYDVPNVSDTYDRDMVGHTWAMLPAGLTCLDCDLAADDNESHFPKGKVSRKFDFDDFTEIAASGAFNIDVRQGSEYKISADGSQRFVDNLEIEKGGDRLKIKSRHGINFLGKSHRGTVSITLPGLSKLEITGASQAVISGFDGGKMKLEVTGASEVEMKSSFEELKVEVSGASTTTLSGSGTELKATVNGASRLKAFGYETKNCTIHVNGASKAEVNATEELTAEANGASDILYKGLPKITSDVTGFSSMKPSK